MHWKIGLVGFGNVGKAFVSLFSEMGALWSKNFGIDVSFNFILNSKGGIIDEHGIKDENLRKATENKEGLLSLKDWREGLKFEDVIDKGKINLLVEVSPTNIKDGEPALSYIKNALSRGIHVVTGNKGPFLYNFRELFKIAEDKGCFLGIGCTAGAALPTINFGIHSLSGTRIDRIEGVLNGVCNYILTSMENKGISFEEALYEAQKMGIAEKDPSLDIDGWDTASKILIIANYLMGSSLTLKDVPVEGIRKLRVEEIEKAKEKGKRLKLVGLAERAGENVRVEVRVLEVGRENFLFDLEGTNKGILYRSFPAGEFIVKGGASSPLGAAYSLWRDILNFSLSK